LINIVPEISIVIPTYKDWDKLKLCLSALNNQSLPKELFEIIVVNNDPSTEIPYSVDHIENLLILLEEKPGSYSARNKGLQHAKGSLIVFTDSDCVPNENWLQLLFDEYQVTGGNALIAGDIDVQKIGPGKASVIEQYDMVLGLPQKRYISRGYAVTANLAIPRHVFDLIGVFDDKRFSGGDSEICRRAKRFGYHLVLSEQAIVKHPARSSWVELVTKVKRVKGGQIKNGSFKMRFMFFTRSFLPPFRLYYKIIKKPGLSLSDVIKLLGVQTALWWVEMSEVVKLSFGSTPERR
jgi:glycosyltransferase involved in cell wall biosynthesis